MGLRFLLTKLLECSFFVWIGQSAVYQATEESRGLGSHNGDDVIPLSVLCHRANACRQRKIPLLFTPCAMKFGEF